MIYNINICMFIYIIDDYYNEVNLSFIALLVYIGTATSEGTQRMIILLADIRMEDVNTH